MCGAALLMTRQTMMATTMPIAQTVAMTPMALLPQLMTVTVTTLAEATGTLASHGTDDTSLIKRPAQAATQRLRWRPGGVGGIVRLGRPVA